MLSREEAVKMAAGQVLARVPRLLTHTNYRIEDLINGEDLANAQRKAIVVSQDAESQFIIQSRTEVWSVKDRTIRTELPILIPRALRYGTSMFRYMPSGTPTRRHGSMMLTEDGIYPFSGWLNTSLHQAAAGRFINHREAFPEEMVRTFAPNVLDEALEPLREEMNAAVEATLKRVRREVFMLSERKAEYVAGVKIFGRRPTYNEVNLIQIMWPAIEPLLDTPLVIEPILHHHMHDIMKRRNAKTTEEALRRAARVTSARVTQFGKARIDPNNVMLPRQWRWLMRQKATTVRRMNQTNFVGRYQRWLTPAWRFAILAEFFPDALKHGRVLGAFEHQLMRVTQKVNNTSELPEMVSVFLHAVRRHEDGNKNKDAPFANREEQVKILKGIIDAGHDLVVDNELRQANLGTLYELMRDMQLVNMEPEASLRFGRQAFDFPFHSKNVMFGEYEFVPLKDHVMVYEEGQRLRHCLFDGHMRAMISGDYRAYSVLYAKSNEPVGTLLLSRRLSRDGTIQYGVSQFAGHLNQNLMYDDNSKVAHEFARYITQKGGANG